jgi:phenylacetate-CoA ligase
MGEQPAGRSNKHRAIVACPAGRQKPAKLIWLKQPTGRPDENPRLRRESTMKKGLHAIETASRDEIVALQNARLKWTLHHVYDNVPHYRAKFDAAGVRPEDFQSLADLAKFPFTTKQDLRDSYPYGMFAVPREKVVRVHASSGTTGKPTVVGYTQKDIDTWAELIARSIYASGGRPGDIVHVAYGYGLFTGGLGAHYGAERLGCTVIPMSGGQTEKQVQLICDFKPNIIMVTPSYMLNIADEFHRQGIDPKSTALRIGIHGAEPWTDAMRGEIESAFGIDAIDIYGLSEVIGPGVANECAETKDGPVIWEDHFYAEIIDPLTGEVLPEGSEGELVFTSLTKEAMPVIRYRTRDLTRLLPPTARSMRRIGKITGRSDDMLIIRGVNVFPSQIEELILKQPKLAPHYVLEISRDGHLDSMKVNVELKPEFEFTSNAEKEFVAHDLQHHIKSYIGISARIDVVEIGGIERSIGKAKRVIDKRPK